LLATPLGRRLSSLANIQHHSLEGATTSFSSANGFVAFTTVLEDNWIEAGVGGTLELTGTASLYGNANLATSFDAAACEIGGKLGLRMNW